MTNEQFLNEKSPEFLPKYEAEKSFTDPAKYIISENLMNAVKLAIYLGQPLLLAGDPGTGKTQLAHALAYRFSEDKKNPRKLLIFNTKTTSKSKDLLYIYDSLAHLQYVQAHPEEKLDFEAIEKKFIRFQALGEAIKDETQRQIVLIDEIDKAPRDFPNDLLDVMEQMWFEVPELDWIEQKKVVGDEANRPIVIITSNSEKNLPDAFLRRCVYYYIEYPTKNELVNILKSKFIDQKFDDAQWDIFVQHFSDVREKVDRKKPATAELIFWARALVKQNFDYNKLKLGAQLTNQEKLILNSSYSVLVKNTKDLEKVAIK